MSSTLIELLSSADFGHTGNTATIEEPRTVSTCGGSQDRLPSGCFLFFNLDCQLFLLDPALSNKHDQLH